MLLRIRDEATDIGHKSIVLGMSVHTDYIVKTLILNAPKTQERYMLAHIPPLAIAEERLPNGRRRRVILGVLPPVAQIGDGPMLAIVVERPLLVTKEERLVCTEITARYHGQVVWIRIVIEVAEIAEDCTLLGEAFQ